MCKAFEEVRNESFSRGMQEGMQQGMQQGAEVEKLSNIKSLMDTTNWAAPQAMDALKIPKADQAKYAAML